MASDWISDLLNIRYFSFKGGAIYMGNTKMVISSFVPIMEQYLLSKKLSEDKYPYLLYLSYKLSSFNFAKSQFLKLGRNANEIMDFSRAFYNHAGWGQVEFIKMRPEESFFVLNTKTNNFSDDMKLLFGAQKEPVDFINCGLFAGTLKTLSKKNIHCVELTCRVQDNCQTCEFVVSTDDKIRSYAKSFAPGELDRVTKFIDTANKYENQIGAKYEL